MPRSRNRSPKRSRIEPLKRSRRPSPRPRRGRTEKREQSKANINKDVTRNERQENIRQENIRQENIRQENIRQENERKRKEKITRQTLKKLPDFIKEYIQFAVQKEETLKQPRPKDQSAILAYWNKTIPAGVPVALDGVEETDLEWLNEVLEPYGYYFDWYRMYDFYNYHIKCEVYTVALRLVIRNRSHLLQGDQYADGEGEGELECLKRELANLPPTVEDTRFINEDDYLKYDHPTLADTESFKAVRSKSIFAVSYQKFICLSNIKKSMDASGRIVIPTSKTLEFIKIPVVKEKSLSDFAQSRYTKGINARLKEFLSTVKTREEQLYSREKRIKTDESKLQKLIESFTDKLQRELTAPPKWWSERSAADLAVKIVEDKDLASEWARTLNWGIKNVYRIENPIVWANYVTFKNLLQRSGKVCPPVQVATARWSSLFDNGLALDASVNEVFLFHGTSDITMQAINAHGFDPRIAKSTGMFGRGVYFAEDIEKALQYIDKNCSVGVVYVTRVCLGKNYWTKRAMNGLDRPPCVHFKRCNGDRCDDERFDSVQAMCGADCDLKRFREFIIYNSAQCYPEYILRIRKY